MKVLLITPLPPAIGGIARWSELYLQWSKGKIDTVVVNNALLEAGQSRWKKLLLQIKRTYGILFGLKKQLNAGGIDIAHVNSSCAKLGVFRDYLCVRKLKKKNVPVILQCHCNIEDQLGSRRLSQLFFRKIVKLASKTLVLNQASLDFAKINGAEDVCICPNFIAKNKISCAPHEINTEIKKAVYVGRLYKQKGVELILELAKAHPNIEFRLVGPYTKEYNPDAALPANVVLTGSKDSNGVMEELDTADVFLLLSNSEGFSNAMLEAMARGLPIIATNVGAAYDMIGNDGGTVISAGDIDGASNAIQKMKDKELRTAMSRYNRNKVVHHYESEAVLGSLKKYYLEIINETTRNN